MGNDTEGYQSKRLLFIIKERSVYNTKTRHMVCSTRATSSSVR